MTAATETEIARVTARERERNRESERKGAMRWAVVGGWWAKVEVGHCCCSWQFGAFTVTYSYT